MFKGLRTKIENEKEGQGVGARQQQQPPIGKNDPNSRAQKDANHQQQQRHHHHHQQHTSPTNNRKSASSNQSIPIEAQQIAAVNNEDIEALVSRAGSLTPETATSSQAPYGSELSPKGDELVQTIAELKQEIANLDHQLRAVIKEKDESNDHNGQLYQLIEKLRRNLEEEKEINSSLTDKLAQAELALKEKDDLLERFQSGKPILNSSKLFAKSNEPLESEDVLQKKVNEMQSQLSEKNRQLKIRQQNLNDIKKTLQKELAEHTKTQEQLCRLQNQIKQQQQQDFATNLPQNGSSLTSDIAETAATTLKVNSGLGHRHRDTGGLSLVSHDGGGETGGETTTMGAGTLTPQLDGMSYLSRSSASVDEFDCNDLQNNSNNKEVNHEYLRNVLFRYMTSTDTETSQHLVKALSVLMNFTPEQSAAVKSAMNARSFWLRLK